MRKNIKKELIIVLAFSVIACESSNLHRFSFDLDRLSRIDSVVEESIKNHEIPGAVGLVIHDGDVVYHKSFGFSDVDLQKPMRPDSIFRIASMTKAITTVGVMILYEKGEFLLSDPISDYIPEFKNPMVVTKVDDEGRVTETRSANREIQIIDLLTHTAGIGYPFIPSKLSETYSAAGVVDGITAGAILLKDNIINLANQPLLFDPGSAYAYGLNTDVLGYLIEVVSGEPLDVFFREEIFEPLGMRDTYFYLPKAKEGRLVTLYADKDGSGIKVLKGKTNEGVIYSDGGMQLIPDNPNYPYQGARMMFSGGAGLSSTAFDYGRFLLMLLNDGQLEGHKIISRKSVELMRTSRVDWDNDGDTDFGLGFRVIDHLKEYSELSSAGSYAWGGAFYTTFWLDPEENLIGLFLSQVRPVKSDVAAKFNVLVYQALE